MGLRRPLTESMDIVVYVDGQRMSRSDYTDARTHLDHLEGPFYRVAFQLVFASYGLYMSHNKRSTMIKYSRLSNNRLSRSEKSGPCLGMKI